MTARKVCVYEINTDQFVLAPESKKDRDGLSIHAWLMKHIVGKPHA